MGIPEHTLPRIEGRKGKLRKSIKIKREADFATYLNQPIWKLRAKGSWKWAKILEHLFPTWYLFLIFVENYCMFFMKMVGQGLGVKPSSTFYVENICQRHCTFQTYKNTYRFFHDEKYFSQAYERKKKLGNFYLKFGCFFFLFPSFIRYRRKRIAGSSYDLFHKSKKGKKIVFRLIWAPKGYFNFF